jgi:chaperonin GroES
MSKRLIPQNDRILLKPIDEGEQMYGNIVIPDMGKEKPEMGEVLAVGPGAWTATGTINTVRSCKVGDIVLVPKIGTLRIDFEGEEYYIAQDREVLAVVTESDKTVIDNE